MRGVKSFNDDVLFAQCPRKTACVAGKKRSAVDRVQQNLAAASAMMKTDLRRGRVGCRSKLVPSVGSGLILPVVVRSGSVRAVAKI